jgi:hypothetical protein
VIVYAKRNAWSGTREQRRKLRDGIASFHEAFERLYGKDAGWTARWKTGQEATLEPLLAAATAASGLTADAFDQAVSQDPLLRWHLRKFLVDWALDADFAAERAKGVQIRESAGARGRPLPTDLQISHSSSVGIRATALHAVPSSSTALMDAQAPGSGLMLPST